MNTKELPKGYNGPFKKFELKDRVFRLKGKKTNLASKWIQTKSTNRVPLHYFDPELKKNRVLRYAENFDTPFVDEQDDTVVLRHIRFKEGTLFTHANQIGLQQFLMLHPSFNAIWTLVDKEAEATTELEQFNTEFDAMQLARESSLELLESILRANGAGAGVDAMSSAEIKKDALMLSRSKPDLFLELAKDDDLILRNLANKSVAQGYLTITADGGQVQHAKSGKKIIDVGFDDNPYGKLAQYFKTDKGIDLMKNLQKQMG